MHENLGEKLEFLQILGMFLIFYLFLPLYVLTSEVAVVKSRHGISVKYSLPRYRNYRPIPSKYAMQLLVLRRLVVHSMH